MGIPWTTCPSTSVKPYNTGNGMQVLAEYAASQGVEVFTIPRPSSSWAMPPA
ncbi:MAG: hypothetical protein ACLUW6_01495 [Coriobacteriaceae bacterium]